MSPAHIQLIIFGLSEVIRQFPAIRDQLAELFSKDNPTPEDWQALHDRIAATDYFKHVPDSALRAANAGSGPQTPTAGPPGP